MKLNVLRTPGEAIVAYCEHQCEDRGDTAVADCDISSCPCWQWRFGVSPEEALAQDPNRDVGQPKT